jgi:hypothetical protein
VQGRRLPARDRRRRAHGATIPTSCCATRPIARSR